MTAARSLLKLLGACVLAGVLVAGVLFPAVGGLGLLSNRTTDTVDSVSAELATGLVPQTSVMLDKDGKPIAYLWGDQRRTEVASDKISQTMKSAIVSVEDKRYYQHQGVDYRGTARAFVNNSAGNDTQGASTLTQQYVKNYLLLVVAKTDAEKRQATETTPARKLREIRIALALDKELGKDEVLTRYLNLVPFGNGAYGIQAAAQTYFGVDAAKLTLTQSAMLAGMVQSSSGLNPYNPNRADDVLARRNVVLDTMRDNNIITTAEATTAKATALGVLKTPKVPTNGCIGAGDRGFFCDYAMQYLDDAGLDKDTILKGGYTITTTLDPTVQASVKAAVNSEISPTQDSVANVMTTIAPGADKHRVVAMASSRTYGLDAAKQQTVNPQPDGLQGEGAGSIFKLFTTAAAMEQGLGTNARLPVPDRYVSEVFTGGGESCPKNAKNEAKYCVTNAGSYAPSLSVTDALATSPNTAFVKLLETATVAKTVEIAQAMGLRSYGVKGAAGSGLEGTDQSIAEQTTAQNQGSFTLGPKPVNITELANVGATIASAGTWCPPSPIEKVTDSDGKPIKVTEAKCEQAVPAGLANTLMNAMGQDDKPGGTSATAARETGWDTNRALAGKTGTTQNHRSSAFLGVMNTLASANLTFTDSSTQSQICDLNPGVALCGQGDIYGGKVPARTFFRAMNPVIDTYGPAAFPATDPVYVNGSAKGNVPSVVGQGSGGATANLEAQGFQVQQINTNSSANRGTVVGQSITGASIPGVSVTIYVSTGRSAAPRTTTPPPPAAGGAPAAAGSSAPAAPPAAPPAGPVAPG